tara:strand:- start:1834 stop:2493 length:660 start_codon:yes stop_codon:yes gene_type:complete
MSDNQSISNPTNTMEDANLAAIHEQATADSSQAVGWVAIIVFVTVAVIYLGRYGGGFDSHEYLESARIAEEIASLGGGPVDAGEEIEVVVDPMKAGERVYQMTCIACHQPDGMGNDINQFPPLAESEWVIKDPALLARIVLHGLQGPIEVKGKEYQSIMAPLGIALSDDDIANVLTYVRQSFGNSADAVDASVVAAARTEHEGRTVMWTVEELEPWMGQ